MLASRAVRPFHRFSALPTLVIALLAASSAQAFPGFMAGKKETPIVHASHVAVMKKDATTVVSVMPDYQGSLEPFVVVLAAPADVTAERVVTLKREFVDRLDMISAPRFHEYWEQDPCDPGPTEQEWQRNLKVQGSGFLGMAAPTGGERKVAKELFLDVAAKQKEGEYTITVLEAGRSPIGWLKEKGYAPPSGAEQAVQPYVTQNAAFIMAEVDVKRVELVGGDRAQLSPIRYYTEQPWDTLPSRLGLLSAHPKDKQELFLYTIDPTRRYEAKNYKNVLPPTNVEVDFVVKERMGEFYNGLYDIILKKTPDAFLVEYAWTDDGCGQPCATEPIMIHELLSLGADVFETKIPEEEKNPKPPELTKEELEQQKAILKELKPRERVARKKLMDEERQTVVSRKALLDRNHYVLSRLHYRYDGTTLTRDPAIAPASGHVEGGIALPKGQKREAELAVKSAEKSRLQTRYNNFHPWVPVIHCESPDRYRWGKSPPDYRGLRKTWIADDLTRKSRTQIKPTEVVKTALPELGLGVAALAAVADAGVDGGANEAEAKTEGCGCHTAGRGGSPLGVLALGAFFAWFGFRRQRASRSASK
jgi:hypothetical protein